MMHSASILSLPEVLIILTLITHSAAQALLPTAASATFPTCGLSCVALINAQDACIPPEAAVTDQYVYDTCFCQSTYLAQLHNSPDGTCDAECTVESDRQLLETWYQGFCAAAAAQGTTTAGIVTSTVPANNAPITPSTITSGITTVIVVAPSTVTPSASAAATSSSSGNGLSNTTGEDASTTNGSWISTHWRWILMIAIIIIGLVLLATLAICLKRRHRRKLEEKRATLSGFAPPPTSSRGRTPEPNIGPELWGPHQHMAHTRGWEYSHEDERVAAAAGGGLLGGAAVEKKRSRKIKSEKSEKNKDRSNVDVSELPGSEAVRSASRSRTDREPDWYQGNRVSKNRSRSRNNTDAIEKM